MTNKMRAIHPGEILKEELDELGFSANEFAKKLKIPTNRITSILNGQRSITADTALRLAHYFGTTSEFWMNLQTAYDLKITMEKVSKQIAQNVEYRKAAAA
jgi:addiction module HigA family antidote